MNPEDASLTCNFMAHFLVEIPQLLGRRVSSVAVGGRGGSPHIFTWPPDDKIEEIDKTK